MSDQEYPVTQAVNDGTASVVHNALDVQDFANTLREYPEFSGYLAGADKRIATASALARDLFMASRTPTPDASLEVIAPYELNKQMVQATLGTREFADMQSSGTINDLASAALATATLTRSLLGALSDDQCNSVNRMVKDQGILSDAEGNSDWLSEQLETQELDEETRKKIEDAIQQQKDAAEAAQQRLDEAQQELDPQALEDALRRAARTAAQQAQQEINGIEDAVATFAGGYGIGAGFGEPQPMTMQQKMALAKRVNGNAKLKQIAELTGRLVRIAAHKQANKIVHEPDEISGIETGHDLDRILPSELAALSDDEISILFDMRYASDDLQLFQLSGKQEAGRGPIGLIMDDSGSMAYGNPYAPEAWAKAFGIAIMHIARKQKRDMYWMHFSGAGQLKTFHFPLGVGTPEEIIKCCDFFFGGGTEFEPPMAAALKLINDARYDKADTIFITDGLTRINPAAVTEWNKVRKDREMRSIGILIAEQGYRMYGQEELAKIVDEVFPMQQLMEDESSGALNAAFSI